MRYILLLLLTLSVHFAFAQTPLNQEPKTTTHSETPPPAEVAAPTTPVTTETAQPVRHRVASVYYGPRPRHKARGFRIQVYSGTGNTAAKNAANEMAAKVRKAFPEVSVYCVFKSPRWVCRVGDFSSREAAQKFYTKLQKAHVSNEASIVIDNVLLAY